VCLFAAPATARWTNFPVRNFFLPLNHQIVYYAASLAEPTNENLAGTPVYLNTKEGATGTVSIEISSPSGDTRVLRAEAAPGKSISFEQTHRVGVYRYRSDSMSPPSGVFVVNADARESRLERIYVDDLRPLFPPSAFYPAKDYEEVAGVTARLRKGFELWNVLLLIVIGIAVMECFLANRTRPVTPPAGKRALRSF